MKSCVILPGPWGPPNEAARAAVTINLVTGMHRPVTTVFSLMDATRTVHSLMLVLSGEEDMKCCSTATRSRPTVSNTAHTRLAKRGWLSPLIYAPRAQLQRLSLGLAIGSAIRSSLQIRCTGCSPRCKDVPVTCCAVSITWPKSCLG